MSNVTANVLSSNTVAGVTISEVEIVQSVRAARRIYFTATAGDLSSNYCSTIGEALERINALLDGRATRGTAPDGIASVSEMARSIAHLDTHSYRDGGEMNHAVRAGNAAGFGTPEWVVASWYITSQRLYR